MPTAPTHAIAALAIGAGFYRPGTPRSLLALGAAFAVLPDVDVIGFQFGIRYGDLLGHRGLSHSLVVAALLGAVTVGLCYRAGAGSLRPMSVWWFLFLATASHGLLDMLTDGGLGIALFSPVDLTRYFWPLRPIAVAPIGVRGLFRPGIGRVVVTELLWVCGPSALFTYLLYRQRALAATNTPASPPA
jgi:inner membrane protein